MIISKHVIPMRVLQKNFKSCQPMAVNSFIKWYHAKLRFSLASNLLLKPFYLTRGFDILCSYHWLYLGTVDSFLSVSDTIPWESMFSSLFYGKFLGCICCLIIKTFLVKIRQNLSLDFWHNTFWEPRTLPEAQFCPSLRKYYILAPSVSNFSPVNALFLSILIILPVRLIMWEVLFANQL